MRKVVIAQIIFILITMSLGAILKGNMGSGVREFHLTLGVLSVLLGIVSFLLALLQNQTMLVKVMSGLTLLLTISALMGGMRTETATNYPAAFNQMAFSAIAALIASIITFVVTRKPSQS